MIYVFKLSKVHRELYDAADALYKSSVAHETAGSMRKADMCWRIADSLRNTVTYDRMAAMMGFN
jgi:hypothetical protein